MIGRSQPLTPLIIAREALLLLSNTHWFQRGSDRFWSEHEFVIDGHDLGLCLEVFSARHLSDAIPKLLSDKRLVDVLPFLELPPNEGVVSARQQFRCFIVRVMSGAELGSSRTHIRLTCTYDPPLPDQSMPVWFWLGEEAEAA